MRSLDFINKIPRFANLQSNESVNAFTDEIESKDSAIVKLVYAPDPVTGLPCSDLAFILDKNQSEDVKNYIRNNLINPLAPSSGIADKDTALEFTIPRHADAFAEYKQKLTNYVDSLKAKASK